MPGYISAVRSGDTIGTVGLGANCAQGKKASGVNTPPVTGGNDRRSTTPGKGKAHGAVYTTWGIEVRSFFMARLRL